MTCCKEVLPAEVYYFSVWQYFSILVQRNTRQLSTMKSTNALPPELLIF